MDLSQVLHSLGPKWPYHKSAVQHSGICRDRQKDRSRINTSSTVGLLRVGSGVKILPFSCFHQVFVSDGEEFFSVLLLYVIRDSTQEATYS